ncbi:MAG: ParM/StbA family protein [Lachnospiraceae bacterium]|nr:ParM/StbA family protein [Lachnospiraceae bacterium]
MDRAIGIDTGKYMTKAAMRRTDGSDKLLEFRTKVDHLDMDGSSLLNPAESHTVILDGQRYVVGQSAHSSDVKETTKASDIHRIAAYTAVALLVDNGDVVDLVVGCPLSVYASREKAEAFQKYIFPNGKFVEIEVDGVQKSFTIRRAMVMPEGSGAILLDPVRCATGICGIVDIGGLNCNCAMFRNGYPVLRSMFTNNHGGNELNTTIRRKLQSALEIDLMDEVLEQDILQGYDLADREKSARIISDCKAAQVEKIITACQEADWPIRSMPMIFIGGTSYLLKDEILRQVPSVRAEDIREDVRYINVRGFLTVLAGGGAS